MIKKRTTQIITIFMTAIILLMVILSLSACERLEEREDYIEENGWMALITSDYFKTAKLIGNKEESIINGEAIIPKIISGYTIDKIYSKNGWVVIQAQYSFIPNKLFIPNYNYSFSGCSFPFANEKLIFIGANPEEYSHGYNLKKDTRHDYPYEFSSPPLYIVPSKSLTQYVEMYGEYTYGEFKSANVSYYYNFEDAPNNGYCWVDDLDAGESIKTIPSAPKREGYEFGGWCLDEACSALFDFEAFNMQENGELGLFAKWVEQ